MREEKIKTQTTFSLADIYILIKKEEKKTKNVFFFFFWMYIKSGPSFALKDLKLAQVRIEIIFIIFIQKKTSLFLIIRSLDSDTNILLLYNSFRRKSLAKLVLTTQ